MSMQSRSEKSGFTRLRDFGAFQTTTPFPGHPPTPAANSVMADADTLYLLPSVYPTRSAISRTQFWWRQPAVLALFHHKGFRLLLQIAVTIALLFVLYLSISWTTLFTALGNIHKSMLFVAFVVGASGVVLSSYQWRSLLRTARLHFDLADLINLYMVGIAFSHLLPTGLGGDAVKAFYVGRGEDERTRSTGALLLCRITGFLAMLFIALPALFVLHAQLNPALCFWLVLLIVLTAGAIVAASFLLPLLSRLSSDYIWRFPLVKRFFQVGTFLRNQLWQPLPLLQATAYGWLFWAVATLNCYCYGSSLGLVIPFYFFLIAVPFTALVSFIPVSLNGFGLREGAFVFAFTTVHVSSAHALLLALLLDFQALCFAVCGMYLYITKVKKWRTLPL